MTTKKPSAATAKRDEAKRIANARRAEQRRDEREAAREFAKDYRSVIRTTRER